MESIVEEDSFLSTNYNLIVTITANVKKQCGKIDAYTNKDAEFIESMSMPKKRQYIFDKGKPETNCFKLYSKNQVINEEYFYFLTIIFLLF